MQQWLYYNDISIYTFFKTMSDHVNLLVHQYTSQNPPQFCHIILSQKFKDSCSCQIPFNLISKNRFAKLWMKRCATPTRFRTFKCISTIGRRLVYRSSVVREPRNFCRTNFIGVDFSRLSEAARHALGRRKRRGGSKPPVLSLPNLQR